MMYPPDVEIVRLAYNNRDMSNSQFRFKKWKSLYFLEYHHNGMLTIYGGSTREVVWKFIKHHLVIWRYEGKKLLRRALKTLYAAK